MIFKVPSDAEIQNQARWVIYDDDDPWNQTAADNAEWIIRFKRNVGLVPAETGPGLPVSEPSWSVGMGGTGFSPPYLNPKAPLAPFEEDVNVRMDDKVYKVKARTAGKFLQSMGERWQKPASVFCSRDLENGLGEFVKSQVAGGVVPSDETLRAKAREILGVQETAADDVQLLEKFKSLHGISTSPSNLPDLSPASAQLTPNYTTDVSAGPMQDYRLPNFTNDVSMLAEFDMELGAMDLTTDFGAGLGQGLPADLGQTGELPDLGMGMGASDLPGIGEGGEGGADGMEMQMDGGAMQDYAELYRVQAATASPLRRRASVKLAQKVGSASHPTGNMYAG
jgi:hypothetical protein